MLSLNDIIKSSHITLPLLFTPHPPLIHPISLCLGLRSSRADLSSTKSLLAHQPETSKQHNQRFQAQDDSKCNHSTNYTCYS
jgi:hypothetical protein